VILRRLRTGVYFVNCLTHMQKQRLLRSRNDACAEANSMVKVEYNHTRKLSGDESDVNKIGVLGISLFF